MLSDFFYLFLSSQALYSRIAISLWKSSKGLGRNLQMKSTSTPMMATGTGNTTFSKQPSKYEKRALNASESEASVTQRKDDDKNVLAFKCIHPFEQVSMESDKNGVTTWRTQSVHGNHHQRNSHTHNAHISTHSTNNVLRARRGVVRMLMVVVLTFALCNLPLHARKMWQYW